MKIAVYAICKNEEKFIKRWVKSMSEADEIFVLDTGSTDNSVKLLKENKVNVKIDIINPWRFDNARNKSLELVPQDFDICVCTDLDEVFSNGWRNELENKWTKETTRARYNYVWSHKENGDADKTFYIEKIHSRKNYKWIHPVHEVLNFSGEKENVITLDNIILEHFPDDMKSRGQYLDLLKLSVEEEPLDDRNMHYLGREYMFHSDYKNAIKTLKAHLNLPTAKWRDERCASMRYIAKCYYNSGDNLNAYKWYFKAIAEAPYLREPYIEAGMFAYNIKDWNLCIYTIKEALKIKSKPISYINEGYCWDSTPYDILSIAYYNIFDFKKAYKNVLKAIEIEPENERLKENYKILKELAK